MRLGGAALAVSLFAACGTTTGTASRPPPGSTTSAAPTTTTTTVPPTTTTTTAPEQPGWTTADRSALGINADQRTIAEPDGTQIDITRFLAARVHYALHVGSEDPPTGSASITALDGSIVAPQEAPILVGAFNGGFKVAAAAGGMEVLGQVLTPLENGLASLVIDQDGSAHIGIWGQTIPVPGEAVASVRQNLAPLVVNGAPSPSINDIAAWGATLGGGAAVARSARGIDAQGNLLYAGSMSAVPADLANALIAAGAVTALELDINPYWVQVDTSPTPGAPLVAGVPGQQRPANQFSVGWTRDFVTVLSNG